MHFLWSLQQPCKAGINSIYTIGKIRCGDTEKIAQIHASQWSSRYSLSSIWWNTVFCGTGIKKTRAPPPRFKSWLWTSVLLEAPTSPLLVNGLASVWVSNPHLPRPFTGSPIFLFPTNEPLGWRPTTWELRLTLRFPRWIMSPCLAWENTHPTDEGIGRWTAPVWGEDTSPHSVPSKLWRFGICCHIRVIGGPHTGLDWAAHLVTWSSAFINPPPHQICLQHPTLEWLFCTRHPAKCLQVLPLLNPTAPWSNITPIWRRVK